MSAPHDRSEFQTDREWEEAEEARLATRDFIDADEGRPDEDRERTQAEDFR
jgi:hypothetical protein